MYSHTWNRTRSGRVESYWTELPCPLKAQGGRRVKQGLGPDGDRWLGRPGPGTGAVGPEGMGGLACGVPTGDPTGGATGVPAGVPTGGEMAAGGLASAATASHTAACGKCLMRLQRTILAMSEGVQLYCQVLVQNRFCLRHVQAVRESQASCAAIWAAPGAEAGGSKGGSAAGVSACKRPLSAPTREGQRSEGPVRQDLLHSCKQPVQASHSLTGCPTQEQGAETTFVSISTQVQSPAGAPAGTWRAGMTTGTPPGPGTSTGVSAGPAAADTITCAHLDLC